MARNGSGTYSNPYPNFVSGTVISSSEVDANNSDVATALTQSIAVDGQSTVTASLPMNANKFTGLAVGAAATDSLNLGQAQAEAMIWCGTAGGSANAITLSPTPAITAYAAGQRFVWMASGSANTGATTVAISGLSTIALQDNGAALVAGNHAASKMFLGILNTTSTVQIMQVQSSGTDPLIISSLTVSGDALIGDDLTLNSDAAILGFGENTDVTLTHVHNTGLLLNGAMQLQFSDSSQFINAPSATVLDITATDEVELNATEIELNATLVDVNANLDVSGTYQGGGTMTTGGSIVIPDAGTIGSATDTDAIAIGSDGDVTLTQDLELQHDGAILSFGANDEVTLTHVHDTGLLLNSTMAIQFNDASQYINAPSATVLDINATDEIELNATEIELNATLLDVNANLEVSGTSNFTGEAGFGMANWGAGNDLRIYHTGSGDGISYIENQSDGGPLHISGIQIDLLGTNAENMIKAVQDGAVTLYFNNSAKLATVTGGVNVTGELEADSLDIDGVAQIDGALTVGVDDTGYDVKFFGATASRYLLWDESADSLLFPDNVKALFGGTTGDLQIFHDGNNSFIDDAGTGVLSIRSNSISLGKYTGENMASFAADGAVTLYYDNDPKLATATGGVNITGDLNTTDAVAGQVYTQVNNTSTDAGAYTHTITTSNDGSIFLQKHSTAGGGAAYIYNSGTGTLNIYNSVSSGAVNFGSNNVGNQMTLDASGNLTFLNAAGPALMQEAATSTNPTVLSNKADPDTGVGWVSANIGSLVAGGVEAMRWTATGAAVAGALDLNGALDLDVAYTANPAISVTHTGTGSSTLAVFKQSADNTYNMAEWHNSSGTSLLNFAASGNVTNTNNSYGAISDVKLKENIADASSQWDDIKAVKVRKFSFKSESSSEADKLGVIAQELEASGMNNLVIENIDRHPDTFEDLGTTTKEVKYSVLYMKAVKALQEAMTRIEALETRITALEG